jgi:hypothetical protein
VAKPLEPFREGLIAVLALCAHGWMFGTRGSRRVRYSLRVSGFSTPGCYSVGAKWRRRLLPLRRLTARESSLPWATLSFPWCSARVNRLTLTLGIRARGSAFSRVVSAGSCHVISRIATAAPSAGSRHDAGGAGVLPELTGLRLTVSNAIANRHALGSGSGFDPLSRNQPHRPPTSNRPHQPSRPTFLLRLTRRHRSTPSAWASAPMKFLRILGSGPVVAQAATSCSAGRRVLPSGFSARAHAARLYDVSDSEEQGCVDGSGSAARGDDPVISHCLRQAHYVVTY